MVGTFADGLPFYALPTTLGIEELLQRGQLILLDYPKLPLMIVLWAAMALVVSIAEWTGRWVIGLLLAVGGGVLGYALVVSSEHPEALSDAMTSLGLAAIMYAVLRYLVSRARG